MFIIDFGYAALVGEVFKRRGSPGYLSPEIIFQQESIATTEADAWSFGVLIFALFYGYNPFAEVQKKFKTPKLPDEFEAAKHEFLKTIEGIQEDLLSGDNMLDSLIARMLFIDPLKRPSMVEVREQLHSLM